MNVLIPMAGAGSRFQQAGYRESKPALPLTDRVSGKTLPMVVAAVRELINGADYDRVVLIDRSFHRDSGLQAQIAESVPGVEFITLDHLSDGQASTCLAARTLIDNDEELLIGACDNGVDYSLATFQQLKQSADAIIFTYRGHELVLARPEAHGWVEVDSDNRVSRVSVKQPLSDHVLQDHAIVASFWFRHGADFVRAADRMIAAEDRINGEFYVDQVMQHAVELGLVVKVLEVERYFCWGTPLDYECYEKTVAYWRGFVAAEPWL